MQPLGNRIADIANPDAQMNNPAIALERLAARAGQMHSLPAVAIKVLELTNNPQVDTRALKQCIENDPALTSKILRVVNSSLFGLSRQVSDLNQALALLGTKPLKMLVLGFSLPAGLFAGVTAEVLGRFWRHSLTRAVAAREISETQWRTPGDDAFIAGLLQDLGLLLLVDQLGEPYVRLLEKVFASGKDLLEVERAAMGFDHTMLTARLLSQWAFPESLIEAVVWKPNGAPAEAPDAGNRQSLPGKRGEKALPEIVHLAELLAQVLADGRTNALQEVMRFGRQYHGLSAPSLEALVDGLQQKVSQLAAVLNLQLPDGADYRDILVQSQKQLAEVAASAVEDLLRAKAAGAAIEEYEPIWSELHDLGQAVSKIVRGIPEQQKEDAQRTASQPSPTAVAVGAASVRASPVSRSGAGEHAQTEESLLARLRSAVIACRQRRCALSLMLVELDRSEDISAAAQQQLAEHANRLEAAIRQHIDHPGLLVLPHGQCGCAVILPDCDRRQAVELANQLIDAFRCGQPHEHRGYRRASLSVGVATVSLPPKNFPAEDLLHGASRCLFGSRASGGGMVKSIEIY